MNGLNTSLLQTGLSLGCHAGDDAHSPTAVIQDTDGEFDDEGGWSRNVSMQEQVEMQSTVDMFSRRSQIRVSSSNTPSTSRTAKTRYRLGSCGWIGTVTRNGDGPVVYTISCLVGV